jgi:Flp pilus assembly protein CpaB
MTRQTSESTNAAPGHGGQRPEPDGDRRRVVRRRPLPPGRAVVGGLVVALAMLVAFAVAGGSDRGPTGRVVVARHDVRLGSRLSADDLRVETIDLPGGVAPGTYSSTDELTGAVALAPLAAGDIVERTAVSTSTSGRSGAQLSFPVDRERALDGQLEVGEPLDVLATFGTGDSARTEVVAHGVRLVDLDDSHQGLEGSGKVVVTIDLRDPDLVVPVTRATNVAMITLVRTVNTTDSTSATHGPGS